MLGGPSPAPPGDPQRVWAAPVNHYRRLRGSHGGIRGERPPGAPARGGVGGDLRPPLKASGAAAAAGPGVISAGPRRQLRHVPAISRVPPRPPPPGIAPGGPGGGAPAPGGHREGLGATSCPRARRRHKGGSVRAGPGPRTKGALRDRDLGGAELRPLPSLSPRCRRAPPRGVPEPPEVSPSSALSPLSPWDPEPVGGTRGVAGGTWSGRHSEGTPVCAPQPRAPPGASRGDAGPTCASNPRCFSFGD